MKRCTSSFEINNPHPFLLEYCHCHFFFFVDTHTFIGLFESKEHTVPFLFTRGQHGSI